MNYKYYTGIGSRETPYEELVKIYDLSKLLANSRYTLRSGGAPGADQAFEWGAFDSTKEADIYLPWRTFCEYERSPIVAARNEPQKEAYEIAEQFHPRWKYLGFGAKKLHARNVHQILGTDVTDPVLSKFVVCWTKEAKGSGGTGQALRVAKHYDIPIYDLAEDVLYDLISSWIY